MADLPEDQKPEDDIIVEIEPDAEADDTGDVATASAPATPGKVISTEAGMSELRASLEQERAARRQAEERATQHERNFAVSRSSELDSRIGQFDSAIETMNGQNAAAKREYSNALASGDYDRAAEIQASIAEYAVVMRELRQGKAQFESAKRQPMPQQQPRQAPPVPTDPVEAFAHNRPPKAQAWIRAHPEVASDPASLSELNAAHLRAMKAGNAEGSDAYYAFIDDRMGFGKSASAAPSRRQQTVAAPVSRSAPTLTRAPGEQQVVRLTRSEVEMAKASGVDPKDWAREKAKLAREIASGTQH